MKHLLLIIALWVILVPGGVAPSPVPVPEPPTPAPIQSVGLSVLIVEETAERHLLPESQRQIISGVRLREWLRDNKADWRIWDQHIDAANEPAKWQSAIAIQRSATPWLIVSNGKFGWSGPLPKTIDETLAILEKHK